MKPEQAKPPNPDDVLRKMLRTPPEPHKKPALAARPAPKKATQTTVRK